MIKRFGRIAALADIHSNLAALDAVLADVATRNCDLIVNLGDIVSGPLDPRGTAERLMRLNSPTVRGNHERQLATLAPANMGASDAFADAELTAELKAWIRALPPTLALDDALLIHGGPDDDLLYLLETVTPSGRRPATRDEVEARLRGIDAALILCGHTHLAREMRLGDGRLVVNPGSVGLPAYEEAQPFPHRNEAGSPHARYAIVERGADGWRADFIAVDYDWAAAAALAETRRRPDWTVALRTGYTRPPRRSPKT